MTLLEIGPAHFILLAAALFSIGVVGVLVRKNIFIVFMSLELMLNAANLAFVTFARMHGDLAGHGVVLFVIAIAAAEISIGLAIVIALFRHKQAVDVDLFRSLRG